MREVDAICAALADALPQRHPELFGGIRDVAYLNCSAYSVDDTTRASEGLCSGSSPRSSPE